MLHKKTLEQQLESVRVYHELQRKQLNLKRKDVIKAAWKTFLAGGITVFDYERICNKNKSLMF